MMRALLALTAALAFAAAPATAQDSADGRSDSERTYSEDTIFDTAEEFFGETTAGLAEVIHRVFTEQGAPQAYIAGEEGSGAFIVGLRYGQGYLHRPGREPVKIYWRGPSAGFDAGANASKVFTLIYDLGETENVYRRFPGVDGSYYFVGGLGLNYQRYGDTVLAPIRTGVGARAGVNVGYLKYSKRKSWQPF